MYGAIIGDVAGSTYEGRLYNVKTKNFELFQAGSRCTDDSVMTIAVAEALRLSDSPDHFSELLPKKMREWGRKYPRAGYGGRFAQWLSDESMDAYGSYGNGSGMRVSPCGLAAVSLEETLELAKRSAVVTHDHPEGIKGAQAIAACVYLAGTGESKDGIRAYVEENFYELKQTIDEIRPHYTMDISCQGSVPVAIEAFLEGENFEDVIRTAISVGGDSDTIAAMAGSIGWSYYKAQNGGNLTSDMEYMKTKVEERMPDDIKMAIANFYAYCENDRGNELWNILNPKM